MYGISAGCLVPLQGLLTAYQPKQDVGTPGYRNAEQECRAADRCQGLGAWLGGGMQSAIGRPLAALGCVENTVPGGPALVS